MKLENSLQKQINLIEDPENSERKILQEKLISVKWISRLIAPINAGRFKNDKNPGAKSNCTLVAEKCVKVLAGLEESKKVPALKNNLDISWQENENGRVVSLEVIRKNQADLIPLQEFIETVNLINDQFKSTIDLTPLSFEKESVKYITSSRERIRLDIASIAGSAISEGRDKTLTGIVYYYYGNWAGHLANFFRDEHGHVFFVDAQSEEITETPAAQVLDYSTKDEIFFFPLPPKGGYFIKKEPMPIKAEVIECYPINHNDENLESIQVDEADSSADEYQYPYTNTEEGKLFLLSSHRYKNIIDKKFILDPEKRMFYTQSHEADIRYDTARLNQKVIDFRFLSMFVFESGENNRIYLKHRLSNLGSIKCYTKWTNEIHRIKQLEAKYGENIVNKGDIEESKVDDLANLSKKNYFPLKKNKSGGKNPLKRKRK